MLWLGLWLGLWYHGDDKDGDRSRHHQTVSDFLGNVQLQKESLPFPAQVVVEAISSPHLHLGRQARTSHSRGLNVPSERPQVDSTPCKTTMPGCTSC